MSSHFTIRQATLADAPAIAQVHVSSWRSAYAGIVPDKLLKELSVEEREAEWERVLGRDPDPQRVRLVAEAEGGIVAFTACTPSRGEHASPDEGEVALLYVLEDAQGAGVGKALLAACEAALSGAGFSKAVLWVHRDNVRGCRFYEARGWRADGAESVLDFRGYEIPEIRYSKALTRG